jgi:nucleoid-associated protein YgaU
MFDSNSRYAQIEDEKLTTDSGQVIRYKKRRFLPEGDKMALLQEVTVMAGDRLDLIASKILGDPEQFWRICDANNAMYPFDLISKTNKVLRIAATGSK